MEAKYAYIFLPVSKTFMRIRSEKIENYNPYDEPSPPKNKVFQVRLITGKKENCQILNVAGTLL